MPAYDGVAPRNEPWRIVVLRLSKRAHINDVTPVIQHQFRADFSVRPARTLRVQSPVSRAVGVAHESYLKVVGIEHLLSGERRVDVLKDRRLPLEPGVAEESNAFSPPVWPGLNFFHNLWQQIIVMA